MPDKIYKKGCGSNCIRCWMNRLKYSNPTVKKNMKKKNLTFGLIVPTDLKEDVII